MVLVFAACAPCVVFSFFLSSLPPSVLHILSPPLHPTDLLVLSTIVTALSLPYNTGLDDHRIYRLICDKWNHADREEVTEYDRSPSARCNATIPILTTWHPMVFSLGAHMPSVTLSSLGHGSAKFVGRRAAGQHGACGAAYDNVNMQYHQKKRYMHIQLKKFLDQMVILSTSWITEIPPRRPFPRFEGGRHICSAGPPSDSAPAAHAGDTVTVFSDAFVATSENGFMLSREDEMTRSCVTPVTRLE
ncbi:hypothetical protein BJV74DRAFT_797291 [Russula compacta]|nr:hypothetical protein BJV74DRAFT_797291 [Russula compacta]